MNKASFLCMAGIVGSVFMLDAWRGSAEVECSMEILGSLYCAPGTCEASCGELHYTLQIINHGSQSVTLFPLNGYLALLAIPHGSGQTIPILPVDSALELISGASRTWRMSTPVPYYDRYPEYGLATVTFPGAPSLPACSDEIWAYYRTIPIVQWDISGYVYDAEIGSGSRLGGMSVSAHFGRGPAPCPPPVITTADGAYYIYGEGHDDGTTAYLTVSGPGYQTTYLGHYGGCPHSGLLANIGMYPLAPTSTVTHTPTINTPTITETPLPPCCFGDADHNLFVNDRDYRAVRDHFGQSTTWLGDADCTGFVDGLDYRAVRDHFGVAYPTGQH